jgi:hypothetical protein
MKTFLSLVLFTNLALASYASVPVTGCVQDSAKKAVTDASVLFYRADSLVAATTTNKKGCFTLNSDTGRYEIYITKLGYRTHTETIDLVPGGKSLSTIVLTEAPTELGEVTVTASNFRAEDNKSIFRIPSRVRKSAADAYQALASVPTLVVDPLLKSVGITGKSSIVMVNNIRRDNLYLMNLHPENIDRVEIIHTPGSRYKDLDAIINIITKTKVTGQSLYLNAQQDPLLKYGNYNSGYTYVADKLAIALSGGAFYFDEDKEETSFIRKIYENGQETRTEKYSDKSDFNMTSPYLSTTLDYNLSPQTFASLHAKYVGSTDKTNRPYKGARFLNGRKEYDFEALENNDGQYNNYEVGLYFQTKFSKDRLLSFDLDYSSTQIDGNSLYKEWDKEQSISDVFNKTGDRSQSLTGQVNYQQKIKKTEFETGYRLYRQTNTFRNTANQLPQESDYENIRNYFYVNALGKIGKKFSWSLGTGWDLVQTQQTRQPTNRNSELLPYGMIRYFITDNQNITLKYNLFRKSPSSSMKNPIPQYVDSNRVIMGNPGLFSFYLNRLQMDYEWSNKRFYATAGLQYHRANNYISPREYLENGIYHITYTNAARYSSMKTSLYLSFNIFDWWKVMANGSVEYRIYEDDNQTQLNKKYWYPEITLQSMVNYDKWYVYLYYPINFRTPTLTGYSMNLIESWINASYRINKSWSATLGIRYLNPLKYKHETYTADFSEVYANHKVQRYFRFLIGFRYVFQKGKQMGYQQKNIKGYDDEVDINTQIY